MNYYQNLKLERGTQELIYDFDKEFGYQIENVPYIFMCLDGGINPSFSYRYFIVNPESYVYREDGTKIKFKDGYFYANLYIINITKCHDLFKQYYQVWTHPSELIMFRVNGKNVVLKKEVNIQTVFKIAERTHGQVPINNFEILGIKNEFTFENLVKALEKTISTKNKTKKLFIIDNIFKHFFLETKKYNSEQKCYDILSLLLPQLDNRVYGLKETKLSKIIIDVLRIPETSIEAIRIKEWKKPTFEGIAKGADFANTVYNSTLNYIPSSSQKLTIRDINDFLDSLTKDKEAFKTIVSKISALELKWLIRIILKAGLGEKMVFSVFDKDAQQIFTNTNSLKMVCSSVIYNTKTQIFLFYPIKPMLAKRMAPDRIPFTIEEKKKPIRKIEYFMEKKYDGERLQVHKQKKKVKLFSRNGNDVTSLYSDLIPDILTNVKCDDCILDGEIVVWNEKTKQIEKFGSLKTTAKMFNFDFIKNSLKKPENKLYFIVFDILYLNGKSLLDEKLKDRLKELKIIREIPHKLEVIKNTLVTDMKDINKGIEKAMEQKEEGIVIKDTESTYQPDSRTNSWIKLKPHFFKGIGDSLDLIVIGGYYGTGTKRGDYSTFLLGISDKGIRDKGVIKSFVKIGTGYTMDQLKTINSQLENDWIQQVPDNVIIGGVDKPDAYIKPEDSLVFEIVGAELIPTDSYASGITLRFPVFKTIRYDKDVNDISTMEDVNELLKEYGGFNLKKYEENSGLKISEKKQVIEHRLPFDVSQTTIKSDLLKGMRFVVISGISSKGISKQDLEKIIYENGGEFIQNAISKDDIIIIGDKTVRAKNLLE